MDVLWGKETGVSTQQSKSWSYKIKVLLVSIKSTSALKSVLKVNVQAGIYRGVHTKGSVGVVERGNEEC